MARSVKMDRTTAKRIGQHLAIKAGAIGLVIAYIIFGALVYSWDAKLDKALFWILDVEFANNLVVGAIGLLMVL